MVSGAGAQEGLIEQEGPRLCMITVCCCHDCDCDHGCDCVIVWMLGCAIICENMSSVCTCGCVREFEQETPPGDPGQGVWWPSLCADEALRLPWPMLIDPSL